MRGIKEIGPGLCGDVVPCCQGDHDGESCTKDCSCWFDVLEPLPGARVSREGPVVVLNYDGLAYRAPGGVYLGTTTGLLNLDATLAEIARGLSGLPSGYMRVSLTLEMSLPDERVRLAEDDGVVRDVLTPEGWEWLREQLSAPKGTPA